MLAVSFCDVPFYVSMIKRESLYDVANEELSKSITIWNQCFWSVSLLNMIFYNLLIMMTLQTWWCKMLNFQPFLLKCLGFSFCIYGLNLSLLPLWLSLSAVSRGLCGSQQVFGFQSKSDRGATRLWL